MIENLSIGSPNWKEQKSTGLEKLEMNPKTQEVYFNGTSVSLTPMEFQVLWLLNRANGGIVSEAELSEFIYDDPQADLPVGNTITVFLSRVREKIEGCGFQITTVRGLGYKLEKI